MPSKKGPPKLFGAAKAAAAAAKILAKDAAAKVESSEDEAILAEDDGELNDDGTADGTTADEPSSSMPTGDGMSVKGTKAALLAKKAAAAAVVSAVTNSMKGAALADNGRSCTGVLTSHPQSRDVHIDSFTLLFHGHDLLVDARLELNYGRWVTVLLCYCWALLSLGKQRSVESFTEQLRKLLPQDQALDLYT